MNLSVHGKFRALRHSAQRLSAQKGLQITLSTGETQLNNAMACAECCYAECRILFATMLSVITLNVVMLSVVMLNFVEPNLKLSGELGPYSQHNHFFELKNGPNRLECYIKIVLILPVRQGFLHSLLFFPPIRHQYSILTKYFHLFLPS